MKRPKSTAMWDTFTVCGCNYLAVRTNGPCGGCVTIVDRKCGSYGNWPSVENFKRAITRQCNKPAAGICTKIERVRIRFETVEEGAISQ